MSDDDSNRSASVAAQHDVYPRGKLKVAPTDGSTKFNTIRIPLIPVACWRLGDPGFAFDSSFVAPAFRDELTTLSGIVGANPECPAALFGHCDPAGSDALNKTLGDRRVIAIYALLTRQPDLWADLYDKPEVGDRWGLHAVQTMLSVIVGRSIDDHGNPEADPSSTPYYGGAIYGQNGAQTAGAVKAFQSDCGQAASGTADAATRKVLFGAYMDAGASGVQSGRSAGEHTCAGAFVDAACSVPDAGDGFSRRCGGATRGFAEDVTAGVQQVQSRRPADERGDGGVRRHHDTERRRRSESASGDVHVRQRDEGRLERMAMPESERDRRWV